MKKEKVVLTLEEGRTYKSFNGDLMKVKKINSETDLVHIFNISEASSLWIPMEWAQKKLVKLIR